MYDKGKQVGLILGPALLLIFCFLLPLPKGMSQAAMNTAGITAMMAVWWVTEAIPIPATSLLPIVLFPLFKVMPTAKATLPYSDHLIYLFMGGFFIAVAMERWNLHYRVAMKTIKIVGTSPTRMLLGFMVAAGSMSMWVSNTATAVMMMPIGMAIIEATGEITGQKDFSKNPFATSLMLGLAYACSIGGLGTIIGTPPNTVMVAQLGKLYGQTIPFGQFMLFGVPLAASFLIIAWLILLKLYPVKGDILQGRGEVLINQELEKLGPMTKEEKRVGVVFLIVAVIWIVKGLVKIPLFAGVSDSSIAIAGALAMFAIPSDMKKGVFLLDWKTAVKIPWDVILLFGGGLCLAEGFQGSGLTKYIASQMTALQGLPLFWIIFMVVAINIALTEFTSNTAVATLMIPIMGSIAVAMKINPMGPIMAACFGCSYAFMLPVATPPNAVVFGSGAVTIKQMVKTGMWLNVFAVFQVSLIIYYLMPLVLGQNLFELPAWAMPK